MTTNIDQRLKDIQTSLPLRWSTPDAWLTIVTRNLDSFFADHASCERKASAAALMLANKYPEHPQLQERMIGLAIEELQHFQQIFKILRSRQIPLPNDEIDPYVKNLLIRVRHPREEHLLDRLLVAAMIEARSCERFCLLAQTLPQGDIKNFYCNFAVEESAHAPLFLSTAETIYPKEVISKRLDDWLSYEAEITQTLPLRAAVH
jgi:tRNA 2-(methylsulfanyl)-N6-isopentenyladenosine37 hydroxylase